MDSEKEKPPAYSKTQEPESPAPQAPSTQDENEKRAESSQPAETGIESSPEAPKATTTVTTTEEDGEEKEEKEARTASPQQANTDSQPDTRSASPSAIGPAQPPQRIYQTYEQDAKHFSTSLWSLPRQPIPSTSPSYTSLPPLTRAPAPGHHTSLPPLTRLHPPAPGHLRTTLSIHPPAALQIALDSQRRLPPPYPSSSSSSRSSSFFSCSHPPNRLRKAKRALRNRRCCLVSAGMVLLGLGMFVAMIVVVLWSTRPGPKGKVELSVYDKEWWSTWKKV